MKKTWIAAAIVIVFLVVACAWIPCLPGDVAVTRVLQSVAPDNPAWAQAVTASAKLPWNILLLGGAFLLSWWFRNARLAVLSLASFLGVQLLDLVMKPWFARPRPSTDLVQVVGSPSGYSFPSTFALTFAGTIGFVAVAAVIYLRGRARWLVVAIAAVALLLGAAARITLGAHWPSDVITSYLIAFFWAAFLVKFSRSGTGDVDRKRS